MQAALITVGALALLLLIYVVVNFNRMARLRQHVRESWSDIDVELRRRYELIPNLVRTVKGYAAHEREVLQEVTALRNRAVASRGGAAGQAADETALLLGLKKLFAVVEAYPRLKADGNFLALQQELSDVEEKIAFARQFYNRNVMQFNTRIQVFPSVVIANMFNFERFDFFEAEETAREDVQVSFTPSG